MSIKFHILFLSSLASALVSAASPDLLIVGGGLSGLAAAAEGARLGLNVTVVDRHSLYGGTAVNAFGVAIVGSPFQVEHGIKDSPELAFKDFVNWGVDPDPGWARYYTEHSKVELFDWFNSRGVQFDRSALVRGNTVARFHFPHGGVISMVQALYREIRQIGGVEFVMNTNVTGLVLEDGRVTGVKVQDYRSGKSRTILAKNVLLSTGGFENNPELVRNFWPSLLGQPNRVLHGSGAQSTGSGLELARSVGGAVAHLDRQWIYIPGAPLPYDPTGIRGVFIDVKGSIWVNAQGRRFTNEAGDKRARLEAVTHQNPAKAWMIFDTDLRTAINITHPTYNTEPSKSNLLNQPGILFEAATLEELGVKAGLPPAVLVSSVDRYNQGLQSGRDDFGRLASSGPSKHYPTKSIKTAPFFALPIYPLARKSMGGIQVDWTCQVLSESGEIVPGLYASGEATGFGGVNGRQSLEGTFVGAAILMGRVAARSISEQIKPEVRPKITETSPEILVSRNADSSLDSSCLRCHNLPSLIAESRPGYWHFQQSHRVVQERKLSCSECHTELASFPPEEHKIDKLVEVGSCNTCHSHAQ